MTLLELNAEIDQLNAEAAECPEAKALLAVAWWFTEDLIRERNAERLNLDPHDPQACSVAGQHDGRYCPCCRYYQSELAARARNIRRML